MLRNSCERITFACGSRASRISACDRDIRMRDLLECCGICASVSPSHAELVRYALRASLRMRNRPIRMRKRHSQETRMRISCGRMKIFSRAPGSCSSGIGEKGFLQFYKDAIMKLSSESFRNCHIILVI